MGKNIENISLKKSKIVINGAPKLPPSDKLIEGELAINYAKDVETISLKNESGNVVTFSSDNYYTSKKLGSGFTNEYSGRTVTEVIEDNELATSAALNLLNTSKQNKLSAGTGLEISENDVISVTSVTIVDQVIDETTSASTNAVSTSAVYNKLKDEESTWNGLYESLSGAVSSHTENNNIHLSASEKTILDSITGSVGSMAYENVSSYSSATEVNTALGNKADKVSAFTSADYDSSTKRINFKNANDTVVDFIDATDFIKDGMVDNVEIKDVTISGESVTCLAIIFNIDSGKEEIDIPLSDIFDADDYYTKNEIDDKLGSGFTGANSANTVTKVIEDNEKVTANALIDLDERVDDLNERISHIVVEILTEITYSDLVTLRNASGLTPGQQYRITDYVTTTAQENTQSAGHQFDVIVTADDENHLNEVTRAILHSEDTYFASCKLEAWELKYCLDNDTNRFAWADTTNGKGVIYYMKDEFNNELGYDFKNVQYKRWKVADAHVGRTGINGKYYGVLGTQCKNISIPDETDFIWCYTFCDETELTDNSISGICFENSFYDNAKNRNIVLFGTSYYNKLNDSKNNTFIDLQRNNITLIEDCILVHFQNNTNIYQIYKCSVAGATENIFQSFYNTSLDEGFQLNMFLGSTSSNVIGKNFRRNFVSEMHYCNIGDNCKQNHFSSRFYYNNLSNNVSRSHFGANVRYLTIDKDYVENIIVEDGNSYITLTSNQTTSESTPIRNIKICQGVNNGTSESDRKTISHNTLSDTFQTEYKPINSQIINV